MLWQLNGIVVDVICSARWFASLRSASVCLFFGCCCCYCCCSNREKEAINRSRQIKECSRARECLSYCCWWCLQNPHTHTHNLRIYLYVIKVYIRREKRERDIEWARARSTPQRMRISVLLYVAVVNIFNARFEGLTLEWL